MFPPQGGGVKKLSELEIDVDKDWLNQNILNFGATGINLHDLVTAHAGRHEMDGDDPVGIIGQKLSIPSGTVRKIPSGFVTTLLTAHDKTFTVDGELDVDGEFMLIDLGD